MDKHRRLVFICCIVVVAVSLGLILYPLVSNYLAERNRSQVIARYDNLVESLNEQDYTWMLALARTYNETLIPRVDEKEHFTDEYLREAAESYYELLNINDFGMMGYVDIPGIDVYLPIYHGTDAETLEIGVGHIIGTSLPVGGESTHSALSAHSGMASQKMFSDLDDMERGDIFYIHIMNETLAYQVTDINIVLPEELSLLSIQKGKDLVTLITCTPFGVNSHRLLVTGTRCPYEDAEVIEAIKEEAQSEGQVHKWTREYIEGLFVGVCAVLIVLSAIVVYRHISSRKNHEKGR